jgi:hypothetical protein
MKDLLKLTFSPVEIVKDWSRHLKKE